MISFHFNCHSVTMATEQLVTMLDVLPSWWHHQNHHHTPIHFPLRYVIYRQGGKVRSHVTYLLRDDRAWKSHHQTGCPILLIYPGVRKLKKKNMWNTTRKHAKISKKISDVKKTGNFLWIGKKIYPPSSII